MLSPYEAPHPASPGHFPDRPGYCGCPGCSSELASCGDVIDELADRLGGVDVFVNNAGTGSSTLALDMKIEQWRHGGRGGHRAGVFLALGVRLPVGRSPASLSPPGGCGRGACAERARRMSIEPLTSDDPGEVAGYRLHARLGAGGMGRVYLAFTPGGRPVALKMVRPELCDDREFRNRFQHEVEAARRVHGLYTAQVLEADPVATLPWLATAYVPGPSLHEAVTGHGPMPVETVLVLMAGVAEALHAIHAAGVVHRDLKPSNVLLAPDGPRVIDFGISRAAEATALTRSGIRVGSPTYMAPEQVAGLSVSAAADVFALGSLAAYAVLGRPPFGEGSEVAVMYRVLHEAADLSGCPPPLREIIERCLAKDAAKRPTPAEIINLCRVQTAGKTRQIAQPWLPPAVAAALAGHAPLSPSARAAMPSSNDVDPPLPDRDKWLPRIAAWQHVHHPPASTATAAVPAGGLPPTGRRRPSRAWLLGTCAAILLAAVAGAGLLVLKPSILPAASGARGTGSTPAAASPSKWWLSGTWIGAADQPAGVVTHWTAELTFPDVGRVGTFRFPSLGCSGTLIVTSATHRTASVYEDMTRNPRKLCAPGGLMKLTRSSANGMDMAWHDSTDQNNVATAHLNRRVSSNQP